MTKDITPERIANSIMQDTYDGTYVIVEGISDYYLYSKFIDCENCQITIAHGKTNVTDAVTILNNRKFEKKLGIIDSDFKHIENESKEIKNLVQTDLHDLEMMIIQSSAFDHVINLYRVKSKLDAFLNEMRKDLRSILLDIASPIGYLKLLEKRHRFGLVFKPKNPDGRPLSYTNFIDSTSMEFKGQKSLIQSVINYSTNKSKKVEKLGVIEKALKDISRIEFDLWQLCNGHDMCNIIAISLRKKISNKNAKSVDYRTIEKDLILAYDSSSFRETKLFEQIRKWEESNPNKKILSNSFAVK